MIYDNITKLIGNTPTMRLNNIEKAEGLSAHLFGKLEAFNPAGSAKDRVALAFIEEAIKTGELKAGGTLVEPTSGNTGIALAAVARIYGLNVILTMPDSMSIERQNLLKAYGAKLVLTPAAEGMGGAVKKAKEIKESIAGAFSPCQFDNPVGALAHYKSTGVELWRDMEGKIDAFVATVGTGGTITGTARYLKEQNPNIKVFAVEPEASPLLSEGRSGAHKIQGIGANFIPTVLDRNIYDTVLTVSNEGAYAGARLMAEKEGFLVGISSGAALMGAISLAKKEEWQGKNIALIMPDTGERYLSSGVF